MARACCISGAFALQIGLHVINQLFRMVINMSLVFLVKVENMKKDDWVKLLFPSIPSLLIGWYLGILPNVGFSILGLLALLLFFIVLIVFAATFWSDPELELSLESSIDPNSHIHVGRGAKFQLIWNIKNNTDRQILIVSYNIRVRGKNFNFKKDYEWKDDWKTAIAANKTLRKDWALVGPEYYDVVADGIYEFQSLIEFRLFNGDRKFTFSSCEIDVEGYNTDEKRVRDKTRGILEGMGG